MKQIIINAQGLKEIKEAVKYHTDQDLTPEQVGAWASDIEAKWVEGDPVMFEISQFKTLTGRPVVIHISEEGYDFEDWDEE